MFNSINEYIKPIYWENAVNSCLSPKNGCSLANLKQLNICIFKSIFSAALPSVNEVQVEKIFETVKKTFSQTIYPKDIQQTKLSPSQLIDYYVTRFNEEAIKDSSIVETLEKISETIRGYFTQAVCCYAPTAKDLNFCSCVLTEKIKAKCPVILPIEKIQPGDSQSNRVAELFLICFFGITLFWCATRPPHRR